MPNGERVHIAIMAAESADLYRAVSAPAGRRNAQLANGGMPDLTTMSTIRMYQPTRQPSYILLINDSSRRNLE